MVLLGLSYGGGLALQMAADHPEQIQSAILAAPYVFPLPDQDQLIKQVVSLLQNFSEAGHNQAVQKLKNTMRQISPMLPEASINGFVGYLTYGWPQWSTLTYDDLYDLVLRALITSTYHLVEPEILKWDPPYQAIAAAELVRGIRHLDYRRLLSKNFHVPLHLVEAGREQYVPKDLLEEFWSAVPDSVRGSVLEIQDVEHKMNETAGAFLAAWAWDVATNPDFLRYPGRFLGNPQRSVAVEMEGSHRVIALGNCEKVLAK